MISTPGVTTSILQENPWITPNIYVDLRWELHSTDNLPNISFPLSVDSSKPSDAYMSVNNAIVGSDNELSQVGAKP